MLVTSALTAIGWAAYTLIILALLFLVGITQHVLFFYTKEVKENLVETKKENLWLVCIAIITTAVTHYLNIKLNLGPIIASGLVGVAASLILPSPFAVMAYTASFVGMTSLARFPSWHYVITSGFVVGGIYMLSRRIYQGYGGRLGTIAAVSVILTLGLLRLVS